MTPVFRIRYRERNMKVFTPPATFDVLWMEFGQSLDCIKRLLLDFFLALSKLFRTFSHVLAALWEGLELVAYVLLSLINLIWLIMKIILLLGEQIKAMGPGGPPQNPDYYRKDQEKPDSLKRNNVNSDSNTSQRVSSHELRTLRNMAGNSDSKYKEAKESKAEPSNSTKKEAGQTLVTKEEDSTRKDLYKYNRLYLLNPESTDTEKDTKDDSGKEDLLLSNQMTRANQSQSNQSSDLNPRVSASSAAARSPYYRYSESQRMSLTGHLPGSLTNRSPSSPASKSSPQ